MMKKWNLDFVTVVTPVMMNMLPAQNTVTRA